MAGYIESWFGERLNTRVLLAIYAFIPLSWVFILTDWVFLDLWLSRQLPVDPHSVLYFNLFFMLPHIFASFFTFADREYIGNYQPRLLIVMPLIVLVVAISELGWVDDVYLFFLIAVYTMYHLASQQAGMAAIVARNRSLAHDLWRWLTILVSVVVYLTIITANPFFIDFVRHMILPFLLLLIVLAGVLVSQSRTLEGRFYYVANSALAGSLCVFFLMALPFYLILLPRLVHDISAFYFYILHNRNRNRERPHNVVSRLGQKVRLPEYLWTPLVGILTTALVTFTMGPWMPAILLFCALTHYYWEGVIWKNGTIHRRYIVL